MPRLRDQSVLNRGLLQQPLLWQQDGFALAIGYDDATNRYQGLWLPTGGEPPAVNDATLIVQPGRAVSQREVDLDIVRPDPDEIEAIGQSGGQPAGSKEPVPPRKPSKTRFFGSKELNPERYAVDFKRIADEVLVHLAAHQGARLSVRIEIEATADDGFDDSRVRTVSENAANLKFDQSAFEDS